MALSASWRSSSSEFAPHAGRDKASERAVNTANRLIFNVWARGGSLFRVGRHGERLGNKIRAKRPVSFAGLSSGICGETKRDGELIHSMGASLPVTLTEVAARFADRTFF